MSLAQAHHHKASKQKEHDVDQRDDLDARSFMRNWRRESHMWNLVRRPSHGKSDGNVDLGNCPGSKSPLPKGADGGVIQYGASSALRDGSAGSVAAG